MLKLDILVPLILIICLIALAYILTEIFNTSEAPAPERSEIVLNPEDYGGAAAEPPASPPANISNTPDATNDGNAVSDNNDLDANAGGSAPTNYDDQPATSSGGNTSTPGSPSYENSRSALPTTESSSTTANSTGSGSTGSSTSAGNRGATASTSTQGKYLVIAGSFKQKIYAQQRVRELKRDGFREAELGYTNRGAYAVALVGTSDSHRSAERLADQVRGKGYEVFVKTRN